jgi:lipopolysaccharide biosynthesis glycosyltransferase
MPAPIAVALAADDLYSLPLAVTARSVLDHLGDGRSLELFVLDGGISARNRDRIERTLADPRCQLNWIAADSRRAQVAARRNSIGYPAAAYYRLDVARLIPSHVARLAYLDSDMLAVDDLSPLFDLDLDGKWAAAVGEYYASPERGGAVSDGIYFNTGLLLIDLGVWRARDAGEIALAELDRRSEELPFADQDAINATLRDHLLRLDGRWNQLGDLLTGVPDDGLYSAEEIRAIREEPYVIHFTSKPKPWQSGCQHPWLSHWIEAVDRTAWAGFRPSGLRGMVDSARRAQRRLRREISRRAS